MNKWMRIALLLIITVLASPSFAGNYKFDTEGAHAFIQFRIKHLGFSWLYGRFDKFDGQFTYDEKSPENSSVNVTIDMQSLDSAHAERDKHLRGEKFFDVAKHPQASFKSTGFKPNANDKGGEVTGVLTLKGVSKSISFPVTYVGGGADPWGGRRMGFSGKTTIMLKDFNIDFFEPSAEVFLDIEGILQK